MSVPRGSARLLSRRQHSTCASHYTGTSCGLNMSLAEHRGWWLMVTCPLCHAEHQHIHTLFTELMDIKHISGSTYGHPVRLPLIEGKNTQHRSLCQDRGEQDVMLSEEQGWGGDDSENSTQWNEVNLYPSASQMGLFLASLFCKTEHTEETSSSEIHQHTAANSPLKCLWKAEGVGVLLQRHRGGGDRRQSSDMKMGQWWRRQIREEAKEGSNSQKTLINSLWRCWFIFFCASIKRQVAFLAFRVQP